jgi:DnaK suppressor protein
MKRPELEAFRKILVNRRIELESRTHSRVALAIEAIPDELDRIQNSQEREFAIGALDRDATFMSEVRDALSRISEGTFGSCVECEESINPKRLAAIPWASRCLACQEIVDREQKMPWGELAPSLEIAA